MSARTASAAAAVAAPSAFSYLAAKDPSSLHTALAAYIAVEAGVTISPKQVQAVLAMHGTFQASPENAARRTAETKSRTTKPAAKPAPKAKATPKPAVKATTATRKPKAPKVAPVLTVPAPVEDDSMSFLVGQISKGNSGSRGFGFGSPLASLRGHFFS